MISKVSLKPRMVSVNILNRSAYARLSRNLNPHSISHAIVIPFPLLWMKLTVLPVRVTL